MIKKFLNEMCGEIRVLIDENQGIWFLANDVCEALGYRNPTDAITKHTFISDRLVVSRDSRETSNYQGIWASEMDLRPKTFINEAGLYCMIFGSKMPKAEDFKKWVTGTVLPSIRRNGGYVDGQENLNPEERKQLEETISGLAAQVKRATEGKMKLGRYLSEEEDRVFGLQEELAHLARIIGRIPDDVWACYTEMERDKKEKKYSVDKSGFRIQYPGYGKR